MSRRLPSGLVDSASLARSWDSADDMASQQHLLWPRVSTRYPSPPPGADILFWCEIDRGGTYYCKGDRGKIPTRATEWFFTHLARHVGLLTPEASVVEDPATGETFFGSLHAGSTNDQIHLDRFLAEPQLNELGQTGDWPSSYLSSLYAFDLFCGNWDRSRQNFRLVREGRSARVYVFDFACASIDGLLSCNFPIATGPTISVGRFYRQQHGFNPRSAIEMADRIAATPAETIVGILAQMPEDWLSPSRRNEVSELWSERQIEERLHVLRSGRTDGSLL